MLHCPILTEKDATESPGTQQRRPPQIPAGTTRVKFELGWGSAFTDVDACCICLNVDGGPVHQVFSTQRVAGCKQLTVAKHGGDRWTGVGVGEKIFLNLQMMSPAVTSVYFFVTVVATSKSLGMVADGLHCRLVNWSDGALSGSEIAKLDPLPVPDRGAAGAIAFALYRDIGNGTSSDNWTLECPLVPCPAHKGAEGLPTVQALHAQRMAAFPPPANYAELLAAHDKRHDTLVKDFSCCVVM